MKTSRLWFRLFLILGVLSAGCTGTSIWELSGDEFVRKTSQVGELNSFNWVFFVGCSEQRAYLETGHPAFIGGGVKTTVYWASISELPRDIVECFQHDRTSGTNQFFRPRQTPTASPNMEK